MPEVRVVRVKEQLPEKLDPQGRRALQVLNTMIGGKNVGINYGEWEPGASNGPHKRTKDEFIFALHGKGEVIIEGGPTYTMEPYTFIHIPAGTTHTHRNAGKGVYIQLSFSPDGPYGQG